MGWGGVGVGRCGREKLVDGVGGGGTGRSGGGGGGGDGDDDASVRICFFAEG